MNAKRKFKIVNSVTEGAVLSRSLVIRGRVIWAWRKVNATQRRIVNASSTPGLLRIDHLDRVLEEKTLANNARVVSYRQIDGGSK